MIKRYFLILLCMLVSFSSLGYGAPQQHFPLLKKVKDIIVYRYIDKGSYSKEFEYAAIKGMLDELDDPYSEFLSPSRVLELRRRKKGMVVGIGLKLGIKNDALTVLSVYSKSPAGHMGIRPLDRILSINQHKAHTLTFSEAQAYLLGPSGSEVVLSISRPYFSKSLIYRIKRRKVSVPAVPSSLVFYDHVGYIKLINLEKTTTSLEFKSTLQDLLKHPLKSLIIDLRGNGGGLVKQAIEVSNLFIPKGPIVHMLNRSGKRHSYLAKGTAFCTQLPLVILVDESTASSAEIIAAALRDHGRGITYGRATFGKASVQQFFSLKDKSAVIITVAKYLTPSGQNITGKGVPIDVPKVIPENVLFEMEDPSFTYYIETDYLLQEAIDYALLMYK